MGCKDVIYPTEFIEDDPQEKWLDIEYNPALHPTDMERAPSPIWEPYS